MGNVNLEFSKKSVFLDSIFSDLEQSYVQLRSDHPNVVLTAQVALIFFAACTIVGLPIAAWGICELLKDESEIKTEEETSIESEDEAEEKGTNETAHSVSDQVKQLMGSDPIQKPKFEFITPWTLGDPSASASQNMQQIPEFQAQRRMSLLQPSRPKKMDPVEQFEVVPKKCSPEKDMSSNLISAIHSFDKTGKLGDNAIIEFLKAFKLQNQNFTYIDTLMLPQQRTVGEISTKFQEVRVEGKRFIALPLVLESSFSDHFAVMVFDTEEQELYYYDPQGKDLKGESRTIRGLGITPLQLKQNVAQHFVSRSNLAAHQKDAINCGRYGANFLQKVVKEGFDFSKFTKDPVVLENETESLRQVLVTELLKNQHGQGI